MATMQKLYLLLPNHKCPNKKHCPFHPPEEQEDELEEAEITIVSKRRSFSLTANEREISDQLLAEKLAKINQQISSNLVEGNHLHFPRKTSHDITLQHHELEKIRAEHAYYEETLPLSTSTREQSVASDYESVMTLDSGVMFDSCSDREMENDEESLPLIQEEILVPESAPEKIQLKNGEQIPEDDKHRTTFKEGEATLQISDLSTEDAGTYTCKAVNDLGEAETSATLSVEEVRHRRKRMEDEEASVRLLHPAHEYDMTMIDTNIAPEFTLPLVDLSRAVGEEVTFTVTVTCRPEPDVTWFHGKEKIVRSDRISFHHEKGVYRLVIHNLATKDAGEYRCQAINAYGEAWCSCDLKIIEHIPEGHTKPRFVRELEYMTVTQGSLVRLECAVTGEPQPKIKWYKDRLRINSDAHYKIRSYDDGTATLVIEGADVEDAGSYMCVAENDAGSVSSEGKIRVQKVYDERPSQAVITTKLDVRAKGEEAPLKKYQLKVPPDFTAKLKNKTAPEGSTVRLNCSVTGIPEPTIRWFRDGQEIFDGHDYTLRNNYGLLSLEIVFAKQSLAGKYTVEASNSEGTVSCSCSVDVEGEEELTSLELDFLRPKFLTQIEDIYVNEGEDATFTCTATGKPMPAFKWQRDMINVTPGRYVDSQWDNQGHASLTLRKVRPTDGGLYYCIAHSRSGRAKCSAYLHVKAKSPSPLSTKDAVEYARHPAREGASVERGGTLGSPPSLVLMLPSSLDVVVGERLKLDCSVQGFPVPLVTWHKGDRELMYSQRHRIILCGTLHTMEIPQTMALDWGDYIVRATNIYGTIETSCFVNILPKGSKVSTPPDYRREAMRGAAKMSSQAIEEDYDDEEVERGPQQPQAPFFIKHLPKTIDVMEGVDVRLDCILRRGIELVRWSPSSSDIEKAKKDLADEGFSGEFIPTTHSSKSEDKPSDGKSRLEHPSFLSTPNNLERPVGSEAVFECTSAGTPEPEIKWYKDGRLLIATGSVQMTSVGNKHKLRLKNLLRSDEGEYVCKSTSLAGTKTCGAVLTIVDDSSVRRPSQTQPVVEEDHQQSLSSKAQESSPREEKVDSRPEQKQSEQLKGQKQALPYEKPVQASFSQSLPRTTNASHGQDVDLTVQVSTGEVASVKWEKDGKELPKDARYFVSCDEASHQYKLTIVQATELDSAKYTCVVTLKNKDLIHTSTKLDIAAEESKLEDRFKPHFTNLLKDTTIRDGEGLTLECDIEGQPRPQISWIRDGVEIFDSQDFEISMIGSHCKLQISEIYPEDEGKYSCKAVNNLGEAISTCYVTVEELGGYLSADSASTTSSTSH
ncbi:titin-like isoform X1, partial [Biomphalaria pfeifferi]